MHSKEKKMGRSKKKTTITVGRRSISLYIVAAFTILFFTSSCPAMLPVSYSRCTVSFLVIRCSSHERGRGKKLFFFRALYHLSCLHLKRPLRLGFAFGAGLCLLYWTVFGKL